MKSSFKRKLAVFLLNKIVRALARTIIYLNLYATLGAADRNTRFGTGRTLVFNFFFLAFVNDDYFIIGIVNVLAHDQHFLRTNRYAPLLASFAFVSVNYYKEIARAVFATIISNTHVNLLV